MSFQSLQKYCSLLLLFFFIFFTLHVYAGNTSFVNLGGKKTITWAIGGSATQCTGDIDPSVGSNVSDIWNANHSSTDSLELGPFNYASANSSGASPFNFLCTTPADEGSISDIAYVTVCKSTERAVSGSCVPDPAPTVTLTPITSEIIAYGTSVTYTLSATETAATTALQDMQSLVLNYASTTSPVPNGELSNLSGPVDYGGAGYGWKNYSYSLTYTPPLIVGTHRVYAATYDDLESNAAVTERWTPSAVRTITVCPQGDIVKGATCTIPVSLLASSTIITYNGTTNLSWSSANASSCTSNAGWDNAGTKNGTGPSKNLTTTQDLTFTCQGDGGPQTATIRITVCPIGKAVSGSSCVDPVKITGFSASPNPILYGAVSKITWSSINADVGGCSATNFSIASNPTNGTVNTAALTATTTYTYRCNGTGGPAISILKVVVCGQDEVISGGTCVKKVTSTATANPTVIKRGTTSKITFSSTNATSCAGDSSFDNASALNGNASTSALTSTQTITFTCQGPGGPAVANAVVTVCGVGEFVTGGACVPGPVATLTAAETNISYNQLTTLEWKSSNANTCRASVGPWNNNGSLHGSGFTSTLTSTQTFGFQCSGPNGTSDESLLTITVCPAGTPIWNGSSCVIKTNASISASPLTVAYGDSSTLSWGSSAGAISCTASNGDASWSGSPARTATGGTPTNNLTQTTTYSLTCTDGTTISSPDSVMVKVCLQGQVVVNNTCTTITKLIPWTLLSVGQTHLSYNTNTSIDWQSGNVSSCTAYGAWSNGASLNGNGLTNNLTADQTFEFQCDGVNGLSNKSTITVAVCPAVSPTWNGTTCTASTGATISASPLTIPYNSTTNISWGSSGGATSCTASNGDASWGGSPARATNGGVTTSALTQSKTYSITCTGPQGTSNTVSATVTVCAVGLVVKNGACGASDNNPPAPTAYLSAQDTHVSYNGSTILSWDSSGVATICNGNNNFNASLPLGPGSVSTGNITSSKAYSFSCNGPGGTSNTAQVTVTACGASTPTWNGVQCDNSPGVNLSATPLLVLYNTTSKLSWYSSNATSCTASGAWSGTQGTAGSYTTNPLTATSYAYNLVCSGTGGDSNIDTVTIKVCASGEVINGGVCSPLPTTTLTPLVTRLSYGAQTTLTWKTTNSDTCNTTGGFTVDPIESGSTSTQSLASDQTYTLQCSGPAGESNQAVATIYVCPINTPTWNGTACVIGPGASISTEPVTIKYNTATDIIWSSTGGATSCTASSLYPEWTGVRGTSGRQTTGNLVATKTYKLSCTNGSQTSTISSTTVKVCPNGYEVFGSGCSLPVTANLTATPLIENGGRAALSWSSLNAIAGSCTTDGSWSNISSVNGPGTGLTDPLTLPSYTFSYTCEGPGGPVTSTVVTTVCAVGKVISGGACIDGNVAPVVTIAPSGNKTIKFGQTVTLTSDATDANSNLVLHKFTWKNPNGLWEYEIVGGGDVVSAQTGGYDLANGLGNVWSFAQTNQSIGKTVTFKPSLSGIYTIGFAAQDAKNVWGNSTTYTLTVEQPPVIISFASDKSVVTGGTGTTLRWANNSSVTACTISGGAGGALDHIPVSVNGTIATSNLSSDTSYTLECTDGVSLVSKSLTITMGTIGNGVLHIVPDSCVIPLGQSTCHGMFADWQIIGATTDPYLFDANPSGSGRIPGSSFASLANFEVWTTYPQTIYKVMDGATVKDTATVTATCERGSSWNGTTCTGTSGKLNTDASGNATGNTCTILEDTSSCSVAVDWTTVSPSGVVSIKMPYRAEATVPGTNNVPNGSVALSLSPPGDYTLELWDGDSVLATTIYTATCAPNTGWLKGKCVRPVADTPTISGRYTTDGSITFTCTNADHYTLLKNTVKMPGYTDIPYPVGGITINVSDSGQYGIYCSLGNLGDQTLASTGDIAVASNAVSFLSKPPDTSLTFLSSPSTLQKGTETTLSWNIKFPATTGANVCTIHASPICTGGPCSEAQTKAAQDIDALLNGSSDNLASKTDSNDPDGSRNIKSTLTQILDPDSATWEAKGKKRLRVYYPTSFTMKCGIKTQKTNVITANSNEG
jgi:hypothetical protein